MHRDIKMENVIVKVTKLNSNSTECLLELSDRTGEPFYGDSKKNEVDIQVKIIDFGFSLEVNPI